MAISAASAKPIGLLGGTFDPIHYGHLRPALEVLEGLDLAQIRFIPARQPPHRPPPVTPPGQRLALVEQAIAGQPGFVADDRELRRDSPSYTVDTLISLRAEVGNTPLCLLLGMDAFDGLPAWHRWQSLPELAHLVVVHRPGAEPPSAPALEELLRRRLSHPEALRECPAGGLLFFPVTQLDISATRIRQLLAAGNSPRYLLPESVLGYIREQGLYLSAT